MQAFIINRNTVIFTTINSRE